MGINLWTVLEALLTGAITFVLQAVYLLAISSILALLWFACKWIYRKITKKEPYTVEQRTRPSVANQHNDKSEKGFRQLASHEQLAQYHKWIRANCEEITAILRNSYDDFCKHTKSDVVFSSHFSSFVGIPIFVLSVLWISSTRSDNFWFIAIAMTGFGFWLQYYRNYVLDLTCRKYFRDIKINLLNDYIDGCMEDALISSSSPEESLDISAFYDYCRTSILHEDFCYYEKEKRKRKEAQS